MDQQTNIPQEAHLSHKIWYKFSTWLTRSFGNDLSEKHKIAFKDKTGKTHSVRYRTFNDLELSRRIVGYEVMVKIERYIKRHCPEIRIVPCDDSYYAGSIILLVPHPAHGITVMFIPQCTAVQNQFFLYGPHYQQLMQALSEMKAVYPPEEFNEAP